jgi:predicted ATP-grasp superfamily ATP-dependent carboligase
MNMENCTDRKSDKSAAIVLGGYVNGYSIVRELSDSGIEAIFVIDNKINICMFSNKIKKFLKFDKSKEGLSRVLMDISRDYEYLVLFPTDDDHIELINSIEYDISKFCFLPFNEKSSGKYLDKVEQYAACEKAGVPFPKTVKISEKYDLKLLVDLLYPIIIKPRSREDLGGSVFRNLTIVSDSDLSEKKAVLEDALIRGIKLMASEIVPGEDDTIYAYTAYRSREGELLNEWAGRKLSQYPQHFGVFSSASNEAPPQVVALGRKLIEAMDVVGIVEPEFKYDSRDRQYKLMEVNLRSMMWHRLGNLCGVRLQLSQWRDAHGLKVDRDNQETEKKIHLVYMKHEILNLLSNRKYFPIFWRNLSGAQERHFAIFNWRDPMPAICDILYLMVRAVRICLKH